MRKFKLDKNLSVRISSLVMAGVLTISATMGLAGCSKKGENNNSAIVAVQTQNDATKKGIKDLFPTMNSEIVDNASLIILLDDIKNENENGKISADIISKFKAKIDVDNMMDDFNAFLNELEQSMIEQKQLIDISNLVVDKDEQIISKIAKLTKSIIEGDSNTKKSNYDLIYKLFVEEDEITYDGLTFKVRDLSYSGRAIAATYARTADTFAKDYVSKDKREKLDARTNDQNNKAYIKTDLEILANQIDEKSLVDVNKEFTSEYQDTKNLINGKITVTDEAIEDLVEYLNLEYLNSDRVATKDKNAVLESYSEERVYNTLLTVDAITEYNKNNSNNIILLSNLLVSDYENTTTGKIDKVVLDYIQFNSIKLLNTTTVETSATELFNNPYFQNIYLYFRGADFTHKYTKDNVVNVNAQDVSEGARFIANEIVNYTLSKRPNIFEYKGYKEKLESNLIESIQYIQNTVTGECEKIDKEKFKIK